MAHGRARQIWPSEAIEAGVVLMLVMVCVDMLTLQVTLTERLETAPALLAVDPLTAAALLDCGSLPGRRRGQRPVPLIPQPPFLSLHLTQLRWMR